MKDWPEYKTIRYYLNDKTIVDFRDIPSDILERGRFFLDNNVIGSIILTEDDQLYFNQMNGNIVNYNSHPDFEEKRLMPDGWVNFKQIQDCLKRQPYDFDEWSRSSSMYSKEFWRVVLRDIRQFKLELLLGKLKFNLDLCISS